MVYNHPLYLFSTLFFLFLSDASCNRHCLVTRQEISGLSLAEQQGLKPIHAALNISTDAVTVLRHAHARWGDLPPVKVAD